LLAFDYGLVGAMTIFEGYIVGLFLGFCLGFSLAMAVAT
jgi:hypothetical protein